MGGLISYLIIAIVHLNCDWQTFHTTEKVWDVIFPNCPVLLWPSDRCFLLVHRRPSLLPSLRYILSVTRFLSPSDWH